MKERVPKTCITCKHYEPYHCTLTDAYVGYLYCDAPTKCSAWRLRDEYKKGGKCGMADRSTQTNAKNNALDVR